WPSARRAGSIGENDMMTNTSNVTPSTMIGSATRRRPITRTRLDTSQFSSRGRWARGPAPAFAAGAGSRSPGGGDVLGGGAGQGDGIQVHEHRLEPRRVRLAERERVQRKLGGERGEA